MGIEFSVPAGGDVQKVIDSAHEGATVYLEPGQHRGFKVLNRKAALTVVGRDGSVITSGVNTGEGVNVENCESVVLEGLTVEGMMTGLRARIAGIRVVESSGVVLRRCRVFGNRTWGIFFGFVDNVLVEDCEAGGSVEQHGFYVSNSSRNVRLVRCRSADNNLCAFHNNGDATIQSSHGRPFTGYVDDLVYEECVAFRNGKGGGAAFNFDGCRRVRVTGCVAKENRAGGVAFFKADGSGPCRGIVFEHNTVDMPSGSRVAVALRDGSGQAVVWHNDIRHADGFRPELQVVGGTTVGLVSDWNRLSRFSPSENDAGFIGLGQWAAATGQDRNSVLPSSPMPANAPSPPELPKVDFEADLVELAAPARVYFKVPAELTVKLKNTGAKAWPTDRFKVGVVDNVTTHIKLGRLLLQGGPTQPGEVGTFKGVIEATVDGTIVLRPLFEDVKWLEGPTIRVPVSVELPPAPPPPPVVPPTVPPPVPFAGIEVDLKGRFVFGGKAHQVNIVVVPEKAAT